MGNRVATFKVSISKFLKEDQIYVLKFLKENQIYVLIEGWTQTTGAGVEADSLE